MSINQSEQILEFPITPNYSPIVTIDIMGLRSSRSVAAIVDTGFTGFVQIPLSLGIATNLRLWGIRPSELADGSIVRNLECFGSVRFGGKEIWGLISLSDKGEKCLLGMQFLNELAGDFTVSPRTNKAIFKWQVSSQEKSIEKQENSDKKLTSDDAKPGVELKANGHAGEEKKKSVGRPPKVAA